MAIMHCSCKNEFMDKRYGKFQRVMNRMRKMEGFRCASCAKEHRTGGDDKRKK